MTMRLNKVLGFIFIFCSIFDNGFCNRKNGPNFNKRNVVIFFTKPDTDFTEKIDDTGISFLQFPVTGFVESNMPEQYKTLFRINRDSNDCNELFNDSLMKLINWATNDRHMITATVSATDSSCSALIENKINGPDNQEGFDIFKYTIDTLDNADNLNYDIPMGGYNKEDFEQLPLTYKENKDTKLPVLKYDDFGNDIPLINVYNPHDLNADKNYDMPESYKKIQGPNTYRRIVKNPGEMLEINLDDLSAPDERKSQTEEKALKNNDKTKHEMFDIFSKLKEIFSNSFLSSSGKRSFVSEEDSIDPSVLGTVRENPIFELVKSTFKNLKRQTNNLKSKNNGFLMIVLGGALSETSDPFSDLVQSVKYVTENTADDTLVLLTCFCPEQDKNLNCGPVKRMVPYYVKGMNSDVFVNSRNMFEIFDNLFSSIKKKYNSTKNTLSKKIHEMRNEHHKAAHKNTVKEEKENEGETQDNSNEIRKTRSASGYKASAEQNIYLTFVVFSFIFMVYY